jgi:fatty acid desaturase
MIELVRQAGKAIATLLVLAVVARWAPVLCSLLVIIVMVHYARYAWRVVAKVPPKEAAELAALMTITLAIGFLTRLGFVGLLLTGAVLLIVLPVWRAHHTPARSQAAAEEADRDSDQR